MTTNPNAELAALIAEKLAANHLIPADKKAKLAQELEAGTIKEEGWKRYAEDALDPRPQKKTS